jgi:hypothetical protein
LRAGRVGPRFKATDGLAGANSPTSRAIPFLSRLGLRRCSVERLGRRDIICTHSSSRTKSSGATTGLPDRAGIAPIHVPGAAGCALVRKAFPRAVPYRSRAPRRLAACVPHSGGTSFVQTDVAPLPSRPGSRRMGHTVKTRRHREGWAGITDAASSGGAGAAAGLGKRGSRRRAASRSSGVKGLRRTAAAPWARRAFSS